MMKRPAWILGFLALLAGAAQGDEIRLKDGSVLQGGIVAELDGRVFVQTAEDELVDVAAEEVLEVVVPVAARLKVVVREKRRPDPIVVERSTDRPKVRPETGRPEPIPPPESKPEVPADVSGRLETIIALRDPDSISEHEADLVAEIVEGAQGNVAYLHWLVEEQRELDNRMMAFTLLLAIGMIDEKDSAGRILNYIRDENPLFRVASIRALGAHPQAWVIEDFIQALMDPVPNVIMAATRRLVEMDSAGRNVRAPLLDMSQDPDENTRQRAVDALALVKSDWASIRVGEMLSDTSPRVRMTALRAAEYHGNRVEWTHLVRLLTDSDPKVRMQSCVLLGKSGVIDVVPDLIFALGDEVHKVVLAAADSLLRITRQNFGTDQERWLNWWDRQSGSQDR